MITISYTAREVDEVAVGTQLYARFLGIKGRAALVLSFAIPLISIAALVHFLTDLNMLRDEVLVMIFVMYASIICWVLMTFHFTKRLKAHVDQATYRDATVTWHLSATGCETDSGASLMWHDLTAMHHFNGLTVLDFAVRRAVVIPDSALPAGMTPQQLKTQVDAWCAQ